MSAFNALAKKLAAQGASSPGGLAAYIGREKAKKLGDASAFQRAGAQGRSMASVISQDKHRK